MIDEDPTIYLDAKGGVPQEERQALTDEQVERLLDTIRDLPPYVFVMIGLYAGPTCSLVFTSTPPLMAYIRHFARFALAPKNCISLPVCVADTQQQIE